MNEKTLDAITAHCIAEYPREACGFVVRDGNEEMFIACPNTADDPTKEFCIDERLHVSIADQHLEILALVHSHPDKGAEPSDADRVCCEASGYAWVIVSVLKHPEDETPHCENLTRIEPSGYQAPLIGRDFTHGVLDCYTLIQDWYWRVRSIRLPNFERKDKWWDDGQSDLYTDNFAKAGFERIAPEEPLQVGDVILMQIRSRNGKPNHGGVYLGDGKFLHHPYRRLSRVDVYGGMWMQYTRLVVRRGD